MRDPWTKGLPYDMLESYGGDLDIEPSDVYRDIFRLRSGVFSDGKGEIQSSGEYGGFKANPIVFYKRHNSDEHGHFRVILEDTFDEDYDMLRDAEFAIMNGITYFGRRNLQDHASKMYALVFDIDGVDEKKVRNLLHQASHGITPMPNYLVFSGGGVHLYYIFENPISLFPYTKIQLKSLKYSLTRNLWNPHTSHIKEPQHQGINQGFRLIGGLTKQGYSIKRSFPVRFRKEFYSIAELNAYVPKENRVDESKLFKESKCTLEEAREKFPKWYERVVLNKDNVSEGDPERRKWMIEEKVHGDNPYALYDWWLDKISMGASYGHRYFCIMMLAIYAVKCNVSKERLEQDAFSLIPKFNALNYEEKFTESDVKSALECFDDKYATFPIRDIEKLSAIRIERNKRNGRTQEEHMDLMRSMAITLRKRGSTTNWGKDGRPSAEQQVLDWKAIHPNGTQKECQSDLGLSNKTVSKWWGTENSFDLVKKWREAHPVGKKSECKKATGLSYPTIRSWWDIVLQKKVCINDIGYTKSQMISKSIMNICNQNAKEMGITEQEAYEKYCQNPDNLQLTERKIKSDYPKSYWHTELPEYYIVEGDPKQLFKLDKYASMGIRNVEILEREEYEYLYEKQKTEKLREMAKNLTFTPDEVSPELLEQCRKRGIELNIVSEEEAEKRMFLGWLDSMNKKSND